MSEDPIGLMGGINKFAYAGNNAVNVIDPFGLFDQQSPGSLGDFIPPLKVCGGPEKYCNDGYKKKRDDCGTTPEAGCLEKARRWYIQCKTWEDAIIYKEIKCPPCQ